ncbi:hypothetical protein F5887DRAFT_885364 [Amanita rubescens]|nr:hypothetical protein F5887DRAFT_885364 [Amanita rubescens]
MPTPSLVSDCHSSASVSLFCKRVANPLPTPFLDVDRGFQLTVRKWASKLTPVEGDEYGILPALPTLAFAYSHVRKTSNNLSKEHTQRRSIDDIIELAFSAKVDCHCDFKTEESYRLVASAGNPDARSDALVTIPSVTTGDKILAARFSFQGEPMIYRELYWSTGGERDGFSIIGFAGEFKKDDNGCNENQLIMVLATAQAQRKALSLKSSIIMGATACRGCVRIFSSYWNDDSVLHIYEHQQQFNLSDPIQVIRLYVFCSKLERHFQGVLASELKTWNAPTEIAFQSHKWRSPDHSRNDHSRKRRRTEAGEALTRATEAEVAIMVSWKRMDSMVTGI